MTAPSSAAQNVILLLLAGAASTTTGCIETESTGASNTAEPGPNYSTLGCGDTCGNSSACMATCQSMDGPTAPMMHEYR